MIIKMQKRQIECQAERLGGSEIKWSNLKMEGSASTFIEKV
jgi:hypothetical protein